MKKNFVLIFILLLSVLFIPANIVLAHGVPSITVQPLLIGAGSQITITGIDMEPGEIFTISLVGLGGTVPLGSATAVAEGDEGGFQAIFTVPESTQPGSYIVRAVTDQGEKAEADLTVTLPSSQASTDPATTQEASGAQHLLDHSKPLGEVIGASVLALISVLAGLWLVLKKMG